MNVTELTKLGARFATQILIDPSGILRERQESYMMQMAASGKKMAVFKLHTSGGLNPHISLGQNLDIRFVNSPSVLGSRRERPLDETDIQVVRALWDEAVRIGKGNAVREILIEGVDFAIACGAVSLAEVVAALREAKNCIAHCSSDIGLQGLLQ